MKTSTTRLIIILALVIGVAIGLFYPNPREKEQPLSSDINLSTRSIAEEDCEEENTLACGGEEIVEEVEEMTSILSNSGTITPAIIEEIKVNGFVQTNGTSKYLLVEYTDLECPYCKELHNSQNTDYILQQLLGGNADYVVKHYPKAFHTEALPAHQILECIAEQKGQSAYYNALDAYFKSNEKISLTLSDQVITSLDVNVEEIRSCLESGKYREKIFAHIGEAVGIFDAKYVPSTIIINTENGKWISYVGNETVEAVERELIAIE
ncbi:MAG: thioredoxin domain-containing protein [Candidatus Absconditabacteria bacterium]|nr:thioredoxin domain-containing protein [Candidatus Absconditabacteria bacterium]MDD3868108.1 thioredoxin domain-containing protein [Candidatus Absconditabacteria bacterium]MDD4714356.1 thioredoxin domain-containing protein [Candidatus Absconditabacteria bacterium]